MHIIIRSFDYYIVIYINHEVNSKIVNQIKFTINNIDKTNLRLIRVFIYFSQFRLNFYYRFSKTYIILNALNRLFNRNTKNEIINSLDANIYVYYKFLVKVFEEFRKQILKKYHNDVV